MALIEIWEKPLGVGICRGCGAKLTWAETLKGKRMPFTGRITILRSHEHDSGRMIAVVDGAHSHFVTCPEADKFRKKKHE